MRSGSFHFVYACLLAAQSQQLQLRKYDVLTIVTYAQRNATFTLHLAAGTAGITNAVDQHLG